MNSDNDKNGAYTCKTASYKSESYVLAQITGVLTGGDYGNFRGLEKAITDEIGLGNIDTIVVLDMSKMEGINDAAVMGLSFLNQERSLRLVNVNETFEKQIKGTEDSEQNTFKIYKTLKDALEDSFLE